MRHPYRLFLAAAALAVALPAAAQTQGTPPPNTYNAFGGSNWYKPNTGAPNTAPQAPRTVNPVPEPSQWALMAAGVGLVAWIVRRRSKRNKD